MLAALPNIALTVLIGMYAQKYYLEARRLTLTETVTNWRQFAPDIIPTLHPSWRTTAWQKMHPWFEAELVPELQRQVETLIAG